MLEERSYRPWSRPAPPEAPRAHRLRWRGEPLPPAEEGGLLPFGNGRSYGDCCLNLDGALLDPRGLDRFIDFDAERGILRCEAGVLFADILRLAVPRGWFLPVTPGTRFVTVGGAIANDVHGKNHHRAGSFGHHLRQFELLRSDGMRLLCSPRRNPDWFAATVGGLGLTGLVLWAEIQLEPIRGPAMDSETLRFSGLDAFFALSRESHDSHAYSVAWVDCLRPVRRGLRGLFFRANHAEGPVSPPPPPRAKPGLPFTPPFSLLPRPAVAIFNAMTYHKPRPRRATVHYESFFYPLDAVANWNRLFGRRGFYQYQCVVPHRGGRAAVEELLDRVARAGEGSFLSVLKVFGERPPAGWLSFPRAGITLALDLPDRGQRTLALLDSLDEVTMAAGGAVYPAKDARMSPATFRQGFPRWQDVEAYRDPAFMSSFWRRVAGGRS